MYWRAAAALLVLMACWSCTPQPGVRHSANAPAVTSAADRRLLQRLALADPVDVAAAPALPPRPVTMAAPPFVTTAMTADDERRATDCLSAAVYYEARSEPLDGQRAVAQVVLNRVRDRAFPASVCRVVYQRSAAGCQFSFVCDGSMNHPIESRAWQIAQAVAQAALGGSVYAPVGSATHYHTSAILPWWASSLARIGTVGSHIFYRWGDRLGSALSFRQAYSGHELGRVAAAPTDLPDAGERSYTATSDEAGVTVHRGMLPITSATAAAFGVRVHRGVAATTGVVDMEEPAQGDVPPN